MIAKQRALVKTSVLDWNLPQRPFRFQITRTALRGIQQTTRQELDQKPELRPGGLLLGSISHSSFWDITVNAYVPVDWDPSRGGAPFLADLGRVALRKLLPSIEHETRVVGFYRAATSRQTNTHTNDSFLSEADRIFMAGCSSSPITAFIGLEGANLHPRVSVFWDDGNVYNLVPQPWPASNEWPEIGAPAEWKGGHAKHEQAMAQRESEPQHPQAATSSATDLLSGKAAIKPGHLVLLVVGTVLVSFLTYIAAHLWIKPLLRDTAARVGIRSEAETTESSPSQGALGLNVIPGNRSLDISWNRHSPIIQSAKSGRLLILDGPLNREIELDSEQLRSGRAVYGGISFGDALVRLEIAGPSSHYLGESIHVIGEPLSGASGANTNPAREEYPLSPLHEEPGRDLLIPGPDPAPLQRKKGGGTSAKPQGILPSDEPFPGSPDRDGRASPPNR